MKKIIVMLCLILLVFSIVFISCTGKSNNSTNNSSANITGKAFTLEELKKYDGQNGNPAYVAVDGTVYDVTNANRWKNGKHENGVVAGADLTSEMSRSPHGASVLKDLPIVGTLSK